MSFVKITFIYTNYKVMCTYVYAIIMKTSVDSQVSCINLFLHCTRKADIINYVTYDMFCLCRPITVMRYLHNICYAQCELCIFVSIMLFE